MAIFTLDSLVLQALTVALRNGLAANLRLGTSVEVALHTPEVFQRHPSFGYRPIMEPMTWPNPVGDPRVDGRGPGAGRSLRHAGVSSCRSLSRQRPSARQARALSGKGHDLVAGKKRRLAGVSWCLPATRTPPRPTRGKGDR
jgi:hypothetical protein